MKRLFEGNGRRPLAWLGLLLVLAVAAYMRLAWPDLVEFKWDEARVLNMAADLADGRSFPLRGIVSSVGIYNPPAFIYLMAIPLAIWQNAVFATLFVSASNVAAVALCYRLARRYFGEREALVASLLFAASVWASVYSRKVWSVNFMPFFALLFMSSVFRLIVDRRPWHLVPAFLWLSVLVQLHFSGLAMAALFAIAILVFRSRLRLLPLVSGAAVAVAAASPFLYGELTQGWPNVKAIFTLSSATPRYGFEAMKYTFDILAERDVYKVLGISGLPFLGQNSMLFWVHPVLSALLLLGLAYAIKVAIIESEPRRRQAAFLALLWFAVPVLFFVRQTSPVQPHYLTQLYPVQFIIIGVVLARVTRLRLVAGRDGRSRWWSRCPAVVSGALIAALVVSQVALFARYLSFAGENTTRGGLGVPLKYSMAAVAAVERAWAFSGADMAVLATDDISLAEPFKFLARGRFPLEVIDDRRALALPGKGQRPRVFIAPNVGQAGLLNEIFSQHALETVFYQGGQESFTIYRIDAEGVERALASRKLRAMPATFGEEIALLAYSTAKLNSGSMLQLDLYWRVEAKPVDTDAQYRFFNHLLDGTGKRIGQADGLEYPAASWRNGDVVISRYLIPVEPTAIPGAHSIMTGLYDLRTLRRSPAYFSGQRAEGDAIRLED